MTRAGQILIANTGLADQIFHHSIVLILEDDATNGTKGLILNQPTKETLKYVFEQVDDQIQIDNDEFLYFGGPIYGPLTALHQSKEYGEIEILTDLFWSNDSKNLEEIVTNKERYRIYAGYAGWAAGQLNQEIDQGYWQLIDGKSSIIFYDSKDSKNIWSEVRRLSENALTKLLGIKNFGDPMLN